MYPSDETEKRLCWRSDPESGSTMWGYNSGGQMTWEARGSAAGGCTTTAPSSATKFTYYSRGWLKKTDYSDSTGDIDYTYDAAGRVLTVVNPTATWTYTWNKRGLLEFEKAELDGRTFAFNPAYNSLGNLNTLTYPGGKQISFGPDAWGRPTKLSNYVGSVQYHPNGIVSGFNIGPYGQFYYAYLDSRQRPREIRQVGADRGNQMHFKYSYDNYDNNGNVTSIDDLSNWGLRDATFDHDGLNRLTTAIGPWGTRTFRYDPLNNIENYYNDDILTDYRYDTTLNRLTSIVGAGPLRTYGYNARGEVTSDGVYTYTRNNAGQITAVSGVGSYAYDGNGKRIKAVINGVTEYSIYDHAGNLKRVHRPGTGTRDDLLQLQGKTQVILRTVDDIETPTYLSVDLLGSPVTFAGSDGYIDNVESYGPFGEKLVDIDKDIGYTGHAHDWETGLTYAQARFYDAQVGRFLSPDPVHFTGNPFTFNRYAYANNNPYRYTDPTGMCTGSRIENGDGSCASTGGSTTGISGALEGMNKQRAQTWAATGAVAGGAMAAAGSVAGDVATGGLNIPATPAEIGAGMTIGASLGYGASVLVDKVATEIDGILDKAQGPEGVQYSLRASAPGNYPNVRGGTTFLNAGDVWKYGQTTDPGGRYVPTALRAMGIQFVPEYYGGQIQIRMQEKFKIYGYAIENGSLPPGNSIFR